VAGAYSRQGFVRRAGLAAAGLSFAGALAGEAAASDPPAVTPDAALARLLAGNRRYVAAKSTHPRQDGGRRHALSKGQHPFATIFGCVDSRVPPEVVFDQGLGDLFVIRTAGEVVDDAVLGNDVDITQIMTSSTLGATELLYATIAQASDHI
jgi:carbonic anhydrase